MCCASASYAANEKAATLTGSGFSAIRLVWDQSPNTNTPFMMAQWPGKEQKKV